MVKLQCSNFRIIFKKTACQNFSVLCNFNITNLQSNFDLLVQCPLGEDGLDLWHHLGADDPAFLSDRLFLHSHTCHDGKVLRQIGGEDSCHPFSSKFIIPFEFWKILNLYYLP